MSRNLCQDNCDCGYIFGIKDFIGKPIEFRKYYDYAPNMGTKLTCPDCGKVYFGWIREGYSYWGDDQKSRERAFQDKLDYGNGRVFPNHQKGKFAKKTTNPITGKNHVEDLGYYQIDLSYYEAYNDEGVGEDTDDPAYLCTEDDEVTRWYQTREKIEDMD